MISMDDRIGDVRLMWIHFAGKGWAPFFFIYPSSFCDMKFNNILVLELLYIGNIWIEDYTRVFRDFILI